VSNERVLFVYRVGKRDRVNKELEEALETVWNSIKSAFASRHVCALLAATYGQHETFMLALLSRSLLRSGQEKTYLQSIS